MSSNMQTCPLCKATAKPFKPQFYECGQCGGIFRASEFFVSPQQEKERYLKHNNDVNDVGYQNSVAPITEAIRQRFKPEHIGLDFGAGTGSAISKLLVDQGYAIKQYDPFFHDFPELLQSTYDYIACCEVIEHFKDPNKDFSLLKKLLKPNGVLYCLTEIYSDQTDFDTWYYKNDFTHVFFYREKTLAWIKQHYGFSKLSVTGNLSVLECYTK